MAIKVQFEEAVAGPNFSYKPGRTATLSDDAEACRFIRKGIASPADDAAQKAYDAWLKKIEAAEAAEAATEAAKAAAAKAAKK